MFKNKRLDFYQLLRSVAFIPSSLYEDCVEIINLSLELGLFRNYGTRNPQHNKLNLETLNAS